MTADDAIGKAFLAVMAALSATAGWLVRAVLGSREEILVLKTQVTALEVRVDEIKAGQVTVECVREVIEEALDRRDANAAERHTECDRRHKLEIEAVVSEKLDSLVPRLAREIQGLNSKTK